MRPATFGGCLLLVTLACSNPSEPDRISTLQTDKTSYIAVDDPDPRFDHSVTVIVKLLNNTNGVIRISDCTASTTHPPYEVEPAGSGQASWSPDISCTTFGTPYVDLASGAEHTDTLVLHSPWQRLFNGEAAGAIAGNFYLDYSVQICGSVTQNGSCLLFIHFEFARSNEFSIAVQ